MPDTAAGAAAHLVPDTEVGLAEKTPEAVPDTAVDTAVDLAKAPGAARLALALGRFEGLLAERALRLTPARRAIVEAVLARRGHFPIEDLVADLRRRGIRGSKATVYRTLPLLTEAGILQPAVITGESKSYEAAVGREHHDHLVCSRCGKVIEFEFEAFEILQREIAARHGFRLEGHHHQLVGVCPDCQRRNETASLSET